jgi:16S rRNA (guanine527-N7)-methyltransferase
MDYQLINNFLSEHGIDPLSDLQLDLFQSYYSLLKEWNSKFNLTSIIDEEDVIIKHFIDSLALQIFLKQLAINNLLDIGAGAGFSGIPIAISSPEIKVSLLEASSKKCTFLEEVKKQLAPEIQIINQRAEVLVRLSREKYDLAVTRAAASFSMSLELSVPFVKKDGYYVYMSGPKILEQVSEIETGEKLGSVLFKIIEYDLPQNLGKRALVVFKKIHCTDSRYPRSIKQMKSNPLFIDKRGQATF